MWAYGLTAPLRMERMEVQKPSEGELLDGEVMIRFLAGGICGSDLPRFRGEFTGAPSARGEVLSRDDLDFGTPGYPMHEIVGEVVATRSSLDAGTRVVGWADAVRGLREYVITRADALTPVIAELDDVHAVTIQPLACALYALGRVPGISGSHAAVIGLGPLGVLFSHGLRSLGAARVTGVDRIDRSQAAATFGLDEFVHRTSRDWASSLKDEERPEIVVETIGHQVGTLNDAIEAVSPGGQIYYFGIPDEPYYPMAFNAFLRKHLTLQAGSTQGRAEALRLADEYVRDHPGLASAYVTDVLTLDEVQTAYERANAPRSGQLKIVIRADA